MLQQSSLWIFYTPYGWVEVSDYFNGLLNDAVGIIYFSNTSGFGDAIFNTRGRSPNDLKLVSVELFVIPIEDVGVYVGILLVQRDNILFGDFAYTTRSRKQFK